MKNHYKLALLLTLLFLLSLIPLVQPARGGPAADSTIYLPALYAPPGNWIAAYQWGANDRGANVVELLEIGQNRYKLFGDAYVVYLNGDGTADHAAYITSGGTIFAPMPAGGYVLGQPKVFAECDAKVAMFDQNDKTLWHKVVELPGADCINQLILAAAADSIYLYQGIGNGSWLAKLDAKGDLAWAKLIGQGWVSGPYDMTATPGGGLVFTAQGAAVILAELDSAGHLLRARRFNPESGTAYYITWTINRTADQGTILSGTTSENGNWVLKLDKQWQIVWQKHFSISPDFSQFNAVIGLRDGGALLSGRLENGKPYLLRLQANGSLGWMRSYGDQTRRIDIKAIEEAGDGSILLAGSLQGASGEYPLSMKLGPDGLAANCDLISSETLVSTELNLLMSPTTITMQDISLDLRTLDPGYTGPAEVSAELLCSTGSTAVNCR